MSRRLLAVCVNLLANMWVLYHIFVKKAKEFTTDCADYYRLNRLFDCAAGGQHEHRTVIKNSANHRQDRLLSQAQQYHLRVKTETFDF